MGITVKLIDHSVNQNNSNVFMLLHETTIIYLLSKITSLYITLINKLINKLDNFAIYFQHICIIFVLAFFFAHNVFVSVEYY